MRKRLSVLMSILVAAVLTLAACSGGGSKKDDSGGKGGVKSEKSENVLNLSSTSDIPTMDSSLATDQVSFFTFNQTLEGLRSEEHTSELQSRFDLVCRLLLEKKKK